MKKLLRSAMVFFGLFIIITGVIYPLFITGIAQVFFPWQANGSIIRDSNGTAVGSQNIGQSFQELGYFWGRPSATGGYPYNAGASGGSNLSVLNKTLTQQVTDRFNRITSEDTANSQPVPVDLLTASASGLDPHISPEAAFYQAHRVALSRGLPESQVRSMVESHIERPFLKLFGEPRVNVLMLNLALDSVK
ncbi:MAG: potassium-transporting ATPase subunit KdpC [Leptolinea sp.]|jgi:K+-transporting ATPase ATPase C chain|nr:potassium-transporting ATPase subunit KdpC [Leptolinea sp.]